MGICLIWASNHLEMYTICIFIESTVVLHLQMCMFGFSMSGNQYIRRFSTSTGSIYPGINTPGYSVCLGMNTCGVSVHMLIQFILG